MTDVRDFEISNASLVLEDRVVTGGVIVRDGRIAEVTERAGEIEAELLELLERWELLESR